MDKKVNKNSVLPEDGMENGLSTTTIDLGSLLTENVTSSGSFDLGRFRRTAFASLLEALPIPALLIDKSGSVIFVNHACGKISSDYEKIRSNSISMLFPNRASAKEVQAVVEKVFTDRIPRVGEALLKMGKSKVWARMNFRALRMGKKRTILLLIEELTLEKNQLGFKHSHNTQLLDEIDKRTRTEQLLRKSEQRYRQLVDEATDIVFQADQHGLFTFVNPIALRITGYSEKEIIGKHYLELIHPEHRAQAERFYGKQFVKKLSNTYYEFPLLTKRGETVWVGQNVRLVMEGDEPTGFQSIARDITERKLAEQALRESGRRFREVLERIDLLAATIDAGGQIIFCNDFLLALTGWSREEVLGKNWFELFVSGEQRGARLEAHRDFMRRGIIPVHRENQIVKKDGSPLLIKWTNTLLHDLDGKVIGTMGIGEDITEKKQAEECVRIERERFQKLSDNAPFAIAMISKDGTFKYLNPKFTEIFGYDLTDVPNGREWFRKAYPDDAYRHEVISAWKKDLEELAPGETRSRVFTVTSKEGSRKSISFRSVTLGTCEDLMTCEDITDQIRANEALKIKDSAMTSSIGGIAIADFAGNIIYVNPASLRLWGYEHENGILGRHISEFWLIDERAEAGWRAAAKTGSWIGELVARRRDGSSADFQVAVSLLRRDDGTPVAIMGSFMDITDRKRAERALLESEKKYRTLFEESKDAVYMTTRDGRLVDANQAFLDLFGFTREEADNIDILKIYVDPADRTKFQEEIERKGSLKDYETRRRKKDGTEIECLLTATVRLGEDGTVLGYQGIIRDVTDLKHIQKQLLQAQKMEAIGTLAGGIAHDFNNLLQAILGYTDLLLIQKKADDPDRQKLEIVRRAARDGGDLVSRILTFSMKTEAKARPTDLNQEILRVDRLLRRTIPSMIKIDLLLADDLWIIDADPAQIEVVLLNLGVNAQHAMPDGGRLLIETSNVRLKDTYFARRLQAKSGKYVLLTVSDTGTGMKPEVADRIFEPFFTTKATGEGTGLGLAMVHGIVSQHGGHITCYSKPGVGTSFNIYFPVSSTEAILDIATTREMPTFGTETILLVDDEDVIRGVAQQMIEMGGYKVLTATSGEEALKIYAAHKDEISLVILDLIMPGMGGKRCLQELLRMNPDSKVIIASGHSPNDLAVDERGTGARGFIQKPYDAKDVLVFIRKILDRGDL